MKILIDSNNLDGLSIPFEVADQITVFALGLEPGDEVTFDIVMLSRFTPTPCVCPPFPVVLPSVIDELPLRCCEDIITLTRDRPWVIIDAPQGAKLRARLTAGGPITTQVVAYEETRTPYPSAFMRGCACASTGE